MNKVYIKEVAQELGLSSSLVLEKAIQMSINVKSIRGFVTLDDAQKILDAILYQQKQSTDIQPNKLESEYSSSYKKGMLYISFTNQSIDSNFGIHIKDTFQNDDIDNFLLFSYSHNDEKLKSNIKGFHDDFDVGIISDDKPLEKLKYYAKRYSPKAILVDGIDFKYIDESFEKIFTDIKKASFFKIRYNFSVVNITQQEQEKLISKIYKFLTQS